MRKIINSLSTMFWLSLALVLPLDKVSAAYAPTITMSVKAADGTAQDLTVAESGLGALKLKNGEEYGFRPTMHDDKGERVTVTIFKLDPSAELGEVEVGSTKPAVPSKTTPGFTIRISKVQPVS